jgi:hypothetical protein
MDSFNKDVDYEGLQRAAGHYRGERGYCSVIAFAVATGCKFGKAKSLFKHIRAWNGGTHKQQTHPIYEKHGKIVRELNMGRGFMVSNSASRLPRQGTFLIYSAQHVSCLKDGVIQDWIALPHAKDKRMKMVFQVLDA